LSQTTLEFARRPTDLPPDEAARPAGAAPEQRAHPPALAQACPNVTVIEHRRGWLGLDLRALWQGRELMWILAWRDVKVRYKQTVLGSLWALLQPFLKMVVFTVIFGALARLNSEGYPYAVFVFAGLLPWQFFSDCLARAGESIVSFQDVVTKVYFPRLLVPLSTILSSLIDFTLSLLVLAGLMAYYHVPATWGLLAVLPLALLTAMISLGVGTLLAGLNVAYRDFRYVIPFLLQLWMFLTPVIYSVTIVPEGWRWLISLNPMTGIVDAYRAAILGKAVAWSSLGISLGAGSALLATGVGYFRTVERTFADVI
jgi:lipopolysaccharide transport system permease protein